MKKLRLNVEALQVESFGVAADAARSGTVPARAADVDNGSLDDACQGAGGGGYTVGTCIGPTYCCPDTWRPTCGHSCNGTCEWSRCVQQDQCFP